MQNKYRFIFISEVHPIFDRRSKIRLSEQKTKLYLSFFEREYHTWEYFLVHVGEITSTRTRKFCFLNAFAKVQQLLTALADICAITRKYFQKNGSRS